MPSLNTSILLVGISVIRKVVATSAWDLGPPSPLFGSLRLLLLTSHSEPRIRNDYCILKILIKRRMYSGSIIQ